MATLVPAPEVEDICMLVWGKKVDEALNEVFVQWSQGLVFSEDEPSALVQAKGGPCSVIVPLQAYIIKYLLFESDGKTLLCSRETSVKALVLSLLTILTKCSPNTQLVTLNTDLTTIQSSLDFHQHLQVTSNPTEAMLTEFVETYFAKFGVVLFLYSVIMTRTVAQVQLDIGPMGDPALIDGTFGHGNQSLLNLLLIGQAVPNVFDLTRSVAGLELVGIPGRTEVGFLTLLEALRYLQVGDFMKSPTNPIWVLGSESHLTLLFSPNAELCVIESSKYQIARTVFDSFDNEGNGFIPVVVLPQILEKLDMVCDEDYVEFMKDRLDPDGTEIILFNAFIEEFVPEAQTDVLSQGKLFTLYHYNGLLQSNNDNKVSYKKGDAVVFAEYSAPMDAASAPTALLRVLRTLWPTVEVDWTGAQPSIS